ncbi:hypothetical protein M673_11715 [Aureimonas sp. AU20]|nr:hypothetical protein M673_11715 [Aureimonas sp. AU20]
MERVSDRLREALAERARPDDPDAEPRAFSEAQIVTLRAMLARIIPTAAAYGIDIALRLDRMMGDQDGNGWRYEALPTDPNAYKIGLDTLDAIARHRDGADFATLDGASQDEILEAIAAADDLRSSDSTLFDAKQMALWFEEVRSDSVRHYVAHPAVMARIGYSGFANGGETGERFVGFRKVAIGERETWEPEPISPAAGQSVR